MTAKSANENGDTAQLPREVDMALSRKAIHRQSCEPNYSGILSFMRRPLTKDVGGFDVAVWGVPFDAATSNRPGARFGPRAVREASSIMTGDPVYPFHHDTFKTLAVADAGDCVFAYDRIGDVPRHIHAQAKVLLDQVDMLISIGGDHFVTLPLLRAHVEKHGPLALVQFDAHQDTWDDEDGMIDHGTMITRAVREGLIDVHHSIQVGIRTHAPADYGIGILYGHDVHGAGPADTSAAICDRVGDTPVYVSFDIDCLDPACAPGTGTPVCAGLSTAQALGILRGLAPLNFVGMDLVEVSPPYDHSAITALAGATIIDMFLGLLAQKRRQIQNEAPAGARP